MAAWPPDRDPVPRGPPCLAVSASKFSKPSFRWLELAGPSRWATLSPHGYPPFLSFRAPFHPVSHMWDRLCALMSHGTHGYGIILEPCRQALIPGECLVSRWLEHSLSESLEIGPLVSCGHADLECLELMVETGRDPAEAFGPVPCTARDGSVCGRHHTGSEI